MPLEAPDVIVLDIRLTDIDGLDVPRLLKRDEALAHIPVMCVSAHFAHLRAVAAAEAGGGATRIRTS